MGRWGEKAPVVLAVFSCFIVIALAVGTRVQVGYWRNGYTLFEHAANVTNDNYLAELNVGLALAKQGKTEEAIRHYNTALTIRPTWDQAYYCLGNALAKEGRTQEAIGAYQQAIQLNPEFTAAQASLAGELMKAGLGEEALSARQEGTGDGQVTAEFHYNMGCVLEKQGKYEEAMKEYKETVRLKPDFGQAHNNLAVGYYFSRNYSEAWREAHLAQKYGFQPQAGFLKALSERMPEPRK